VGTRRRKKTPKKIEKAQKSGNHTNKKNELTMKGEKRQKNHTKQS